MSRAPAKVVAIAQPTHLGDVISCLPMAAVLKQHWPGVRVLFIAREYTRLLAEACVHIDEFIEVDDFLRDPGMLRRQQVEVFLNPFLADNLGLAAKAAGIPIRVANLRRPRTLQWGNRFIFQGSRNNPRHIGNVNLRYLRPLGIDVQYSVEQLGQLLGLERRPALDAAFASQLDPGRCNLIIHPKSNKSGREWPATYFNRLVDLLPSQRYKIFLTGRAHERDALQQECPALLQRPEVVDLMDRMDLAQLIGFIGHADGMVCNSTGPLHIAGALGIHTLGMFPGRARANAAKWRPLGTRAETVSIREDCPPGPGRCPMRYNGEECSCMTGILPEMVAERVLRWHQ